MLNNRGMNKKGYGRPTILALSRQGVPNLPGTSKEGVEKGGYIVHGGDEKPDAIILATGKARTLTPQRASPAVCGQAQATSLNTDRSQLAVAAVHCVAGLILCSLSDLLCILPACNGEAGRLCMLCNPVYDVAYCCMLLRLLLLLLLLLLLHLYGTSIKFYDGLQSILWFLPFPSAPMWPAIKSQDVTNAGIAHQQHHIYLLSMHGTCSAAQSDFVQLIELDLTRSLAGCTQLGPDPD